MPLSVAVKGASAPFSLEVGIATLRDDALLNRALGHLASGSWADALLDVESACRRQPSHPMPANLRARLLQRIQPAQATKAWYLAWCRAPLDPGLQDAMLQAFLDCGAVETVRHLGPAFLPVRCQSGNEQSLLALLTAAQAGRVGACWKSADALHGRVFDTAGGASQHAMARLVIAKSDGQRQFFDVPTDGSPFSLPQPQGGGAWSLAVELLGEGGPFKLLAGSPLVVCESDKLAPHTATVSRKREKRPNAVHVIIPVYGNLDRSRDCVQSVLTSLRHNQTPVRVTVIDDASPDVAVSKWLAQLEAGGAATVLRNAFNLGFIETCNRGMRMHPDCDVMLLNADTLVQGNWLDRMRDALYTEPDIASVVPWSNNGEISSLPVIAVGSAMPTKDQLKLIDDAAAGLHASAQLHDTDLPSACGFAMLMRRSAVDAVGLLDGAQLNRGYSEEVDWCMRARAAGYRHRLATAVFVAHAGTASFGYEKILRVAQNRAVIHARYPEFYSQYHHFVQTDPLTSVRKVVLGALQAAQNPWLLGVQSGFQKMPPPWSSALAPQLPSANLRIAVAYSGLSMQGREKVLALARLIANRSVSAQGVRLLILGAASESLWCTGVADVLPPVLERDAGLLGDAVLLGLCGCKAILVEGVKLPHAPIEQVDMGRDFRPGVWLGQHLSEQGVAA